MIVLNQTALRAVQENNADRMGVEDCVANATRIKHAMRTENANKARVVLRTVKTKFAAQMGVVDCVVSVHQEHSVAR